MSEKLCGRWDLHRLLRACLMLLKELTLCCRGRGRGKVFDVDRQQQQQQAGARQSRDNP